MTTITPSYHAENYSPDDNRYDLRQFLYPIKFITNLGLTRTLDVCLKSRSVVLIFVGGGIAPVKTNKHLLKSRCCVDLFLGIYS